MARAVLVPNWRAGSSTWSYRQATGSQLFEPVCLPLRTDIGGRLELEAILGLKPIHSNIGFVYLDCQIKYPLLHIILFKIGASAVV